MRREMGLEQNPKRNHDAVLVTLADRNFIDQAKQLFSSVYWNAGWKGDYMLLAHEIPEKDLKWFREKGILVKKCKALWNKTLGSGEQKYSPVVLDKFYLFTPEFKKWKNVVYLDADIMVRDSLENLAEVKTFASSYVWGDRLKDYFHSKNLQEFSELSKKYEMNSRPFNSGIMAFPTKIIRETDFSNLVKLFRRYSSISKGDDPILNLFFYKNWRRISPIYDITTKILAKAVRPETYLTAGIIFHFISRSSPPAGSPFYNEWKENLEKAEYIHLESVHEVNRLNRTAIALRTFRFILNFEKQEIFSKLLWLSGQMGILIKRLNPHLYYVLKKIKDGKK